MKNTPARPAEKVNVVAGDGFFNQEMVKNLGFGNAIYMADYYHLFDTVLPDRFGKYFIHLIPHLIQMANCLSEDQFKLASNNGKSLLEEMSPRDLSIEEDFKNFIEERSTYSQYILKQTKGTRGRRGSSPSEQNHSSILCHLNDGIRSENKYCEHPITLIRDLFDRQKFHVNKWNSLLAKESMEMDVETAKLEKDPTTDMNKILLCAAKVLNKRSYEKFKHFCQRAHDSLQTEEKIDKDGKQIILVKSIQSISAEPRIFNDLSQRCNCSSAVAFEMMCSHEVKIHNKFIPSLFTKRHFRRESVQGSLNGWVRRSSDEYANENLQVEQLSTQNGNNDYNTVNDFDEHSLSLAEPTLLIVNEEQTISDENTMKQKDDLDENQISIQPLNEINNNEPMQQNLNSQLSASSNGALQPFNRSGLSNIFNDILSNYDKCSKETQMIISDITVNLSKLAITEGSDEFDDNVDTSSITFDQIVDHSKKCLEQYKSAFLPSKDAFISSHLQSSVCVPSQNIVQKQSRKRLLRHKESSARDIQKKRNFHLHH